MDINNKMFASGNPESEKVAVSPDLKDKMWHYFMSIKHIHMTLLLVTSDDQVFTLFWT